MVGPQTRQAKTLQVMQVNVGKGSASHDIALGFAHDHHFDIILIQEPWIHRDRLRRISKRHPAYRCFSPVEDWANRLRVLTYVRKDPQLHAVQLRDGRETIRDLLTVQLVAWGQQIHFTNIYNAPPGSKDPGQEAQSILSQGLPQQPVLVAGDFNLKHPLWQTNTNPSSQATAIADWAVQQNLCLTIQPDSPTRGRNTLDLAWATPALARLGISTEVSRELHTTSDHQTLWTKICICSQQQSTQANGRFRMDILDTEAFERALCGLAPQLAEDARFLIAPSPEQLDKLAEKISELVSTALAASTKRACGQGSGQPWWDQECLSAVRQYRQKTRNPNVEEVEAALAKRNLRRVVRKAKRKYW